MHERLIDLDAHATTRPDREVVDRMLNVLRNVWGNASSENWLGGRARTICDEARAEVAGLIGCKSAEMIFTSGATEAISLAISGVIEWQREKVPHVVTSSIEHKAVLDTLAVFRGQGRADVDLIAPSPDGIIRAETVIRALRDDTILVCLSHANNELGCVNPIAEVGKALADHPCLLLVDAAQTGAYMAPQVRPCGIDLLALSAHKMYGPKGIGALFVRRGIRLKPLMRGGGQEGGRRPGTENVAGIAGFGVAARIAIDRGRQRAEAVRVRRDLLLTSLLKRIPQSRLNGSRESRLPGHISITIPGVDGRRLQQLLPYMAFSRGSACTAATDEPSHVLRAMGFDEVEIDGTIRLGLSTDTSDEDVEIVRTKLPEAIRQFREAQWPEET